MPSYYLAAGYADKAILQELVKQVHRASAHYTGGAWVCNAHWLTNGIEEYSVGMSREERAEHGYADIADIENAHAVVVVANTSTAGGKWVEMGYALATNKPVIYWEVQGLQEPVKKRNPFVEMRQVHHARGVDELVGLLNSIAIIGGESYVSEQD